MVIWTPDQRLRVFISATLEELAAERRAAEEAVKALGLIAVTFEAGARPYSPQQVFREYLEQSHIFVGLYWQQSGWVGPGMTLSGLADEFYRSEEMPRLMYVKEPAPDREPKLARLLREVEASATNSYRRFATTEELTRLLAQDLAVLLSERFFASRPRAG